MSAASASRRDLRSNLTLFALGYALLVVGREFALKSGWPPPGGFMDFVLAPALFAAVVALAGYAYVRTHSDWSERERHALALRYTLISFLVDSVFIVQLILSGLPPTALQELRDLPTLTFLGLLLAGLVVLGIAITVSLAIWYFVARIVLHGVKTLSRTARPAP